MAYAIEGDSLFWRASENTDGELDVDGLVAGFSGLLYRVAYSVLRHPADAEDVVQETFLRAFQYRDRLHTIREKRPWLARIAFNLALDRKRRIQPSQLDEGMIGTLLASERPVDEAFASSRRVNAVLELLDRLPKHERQVLLLLAVEELSVAEIAAVLQRSEASVRSLMFRGRAHLQERIERTQQDAARFGKEGRR
jgi:RNA polymerase sigma-70 factor (ECF subfamily)